MTNENKNQRRTFSIGQVLIIGAFFDVTLFILSSLEKQNTSIMSYTKLQTDVLLNINIFPFIKRVVELTIEFFWMATNFMLLVCLSSK